MNFEISWRDPIFFQESLKDFEETLVPPTTRCVKRSLKSIRAIDFNQIPYQRTAARVRRKPHKDHDGGGSGDDGDDEPDNTAGDSDGSSSLSDDAEGEVPAMAILPDFEEFSGGTMQWCENPIMLLYSLPESSAFFRKLPWFRPGACFSHCLHFSHRAFPPWPIWL